MKRTTVLIIGPAILAAECGSSAVGSAGNVPDDSDDAKANWILGYLLSAQASEAGEPSEPKIVLTDTSGGQTTATAVDADLEGDDTFETDERVTDLLYDLANTIEARGDLRPLVSTGGLYLVYNAAPALYSPAELEGVLSDETTYQWPSHVVADDDPAAELPFHTFAEEIGESFLEAFHDPDNEFPRNEWRDLADQGIPDEANPIPIELREFDSISVADGGHDGIEWFVWYVSIDYQNGEPRIVGLTFHAWTP
ncbi:MAG: hypothetical protein P1T08_12575 [Acidimicrobiia bacterium]|nr:hypothetical protein [Acidimicrobiia bacterium]